MPVTLAALLRQPALGLSVGMWLDPAVGAAALNEQAAAYLRRLVEVGVVGFGFGLGLGLGLGQLQGLQGHQQEEQHFDQAGHDRDADRRNHSPCPGLVERHDAGFDQERLRVLHGC
jgi:hypothetical protein